MSPRRYFSVQVNGSLCRSTPYALRQPLRSPSDLEPHTIRENSNKRSFVIHRKKLSPQPINWIHSINVGSMVNQIVFEKVACGDALWIALSALPPGRVFRPPDNPDRNIEGRGHRGPDQRGIACRRRNLARAGRSRWQTGVRHRTAGAFNGRLCRGENPRWRLALGQLVVVGYKAAEPTAVK